MKPRRQFDIAFPDPEPFALVAQKTTDGARVVAERAARLEAQRALEAGNLDLFDQTTNKRKDTTP